MESPALARPSLYFVIPLEDEAATLEALFVGIAAEARKLAADFPQNAKAIRFRRYFGKADAVATGWKEAADDFVFTMDADLQDDPAMLKLNSLHLQEAGYRGLTATSCQEGLTKLGEPIDLVLLDLNLPDGNGLSLVESIQRIPHAPEIVFLTSETDVSTGVEAMRLGAFDYLCKPVQGAKLIGVALRALKHRRELLAARPAKEPGKQIAHAA